MKFRKYTAVLTALLMLTIATFACARTVVMFDDMGIFTGPTAFSRYDDLDDLVTTIGAVISTTVVVNQQMDIGAAAVTVPLNITLDFKRQGALNITVAQTVTFTNSAQIIASSRQHIFIGAGTIAFTNGGTVTPQWWGALGDGVTDDSVAILAASRCAFNAGATLFWPQTFASYEYDGAAAPGYIDTYTGRKFIWKSNGATINLNTLDTAFFTISRTSEFILENLIINGPAAVGGTELPSDYLFAVYGALRGYIRGCRVTGAIGDGILLTSLFDAVTPDITDTVRNFEVSNNYFNNNGRGGLTIVGGAGIEIHNNEFGPDILAVAPTRFGGLHLESDSGGTDRYGIDDIDIHSNTFYTYVTILTNHHKATAVADKLSWIRFHHNRMRVTSDIAISAAGSGNIDIHNNDIVSTYALGAASVAEGLIFVKAGNIRIANNDIRVGQSVNAFYLSYWQGIDGYKETLIIENNNITTTSALTLYMYRMFGDSGGVFSNKTWDYFQFRNNTYLNSHALLLFSIVPGSTAIKGLIENERNGGAISALITVGNSIPAASRIVFNNCSFVATTAYNVINAAGGVPYFIAVHNSHITGTYIGTAAENVTVFNTRTQIHNAVSGAGAVNDAVNTNLPNGDGTITRIGAGLYTVNGINIDELGTGVTGSTYNVHVYTSTSADFFGKLTSNAAPAANPVTLEIYDGVALTDLPANSRVTIEINYPPIRYSLR